MKTQTKNKLDFKTNSVIELNPNQLLEIEGGSSTATAITTTMACGIVIGIGISLAITH
ncbi:hypothetical protein [Pontimicrobium sp. MEBiC01747]